MELGSEVAIRKDGESRQFFVQDLLGWTPVRIGAAAVGAGCKASLVVIGSAEGEAGAIRCLIGRPKEDRMHPAGHRFVEPRVLSFCAREKLQSALVIVVEKDAASAGEVAWKILCAFMWASRPSRGLERLVALSDRLTLSSGGKGSGVLFQQCAKMPRFFRRENRAIVAAGSATAREVAGAEERLEGFVIEDCFAKLAPQAEGCVRERSGNPGHAER